MCAYYHVPMIVFADKETLGHAIGKQFRASVAVTQETIYVKAPSASFHYHSVIVTGRYERQIPKHAHGAETLSGDA